MIDPIITSHQTSVRPRLASIANDRGGRMAASDFRRLPKHVGFIPDGNRRWARARGLSKGEGYSSGILPGLRLIAACRRLGIEEVSIYGYTKENVHRPREQVLAFQQACVDFVRHATADGSALLVVGDVDSVAFPKALVPYTTRSAGDLRVNLIVNYTWSWDLSVALTRIERGVSSREVASCLGSHEVSRIDLVVRWGGRQRLSGFLPVQCAYADLHVVDELWPDMKLEDFAGALRWYGEQDVTLGG